MQIFQHQSTGSHSAVLALVAGTLSFAALLVHAEVAVADAQTAAGIVTDATIDFSHGDHHIYEYYAAGGVSRAGDGVGEHRVVGRWKVRPDGTVCFLHDDPNQSGCVFVRMSGNQIEFHRIDGVVEGPFTLERGNPHGL